MRLKTAVGGDVLAIEHEFTVPVDHARTGGPTTTVFARELVRADRVSADLPMVVWFQGGPGLPAPRPDPPRAWMSRALRDYRVLLLDQRGTGRSDPLTRQTLPALGDIHSQADRLALHRADSIVLDAELIRARLLGPDRPWSVIGYSFGGFCALTYLSVAPEALTWVVLSGGLPSLDAGPDALYRLTYPRLAEALARHFARFPEDRERLSRVVDTVDRRPVRLPTGERLTRRRFLTCGLDLGLRQGPALLHNLLEASVPWAADSALPDAFLHAAGEVLSYARRPLFAVLHEAIYCQGEASRWSAERVGSEFPEFDVAADDPLPTAEMIFPFLFEEDPMLCPLREVAHVLAARSDWPRLYDVEQLARNTVPVVAAVYPEDIYVPVEFSRETAARIGGVEVWEAAGLSHDGLDASPDVLDRLLDMVGETRPGHGGVRHPPDAESPRRGRRLTDGSEPPDGAEPDSADGYLSD